MSKDVAELGGGGVGLAAEHLAGGARQVDVAGVVVPQVTLGRLEGALDLETGVLAVLVDLDVVGTVDEDGVDLDRVVGLGTEEASVGDDDYVREERTGREGADWVGGIDMSLVVSILSVLGMWLGVFQLPEP